MPDDFTDDDILADGTEFGTIYTVVVVSGKCNALTIDLDVVNLFNHCSVDFMVKSNYIAPAK